MAKLMTSKAQLALDKALSDRGLIKGKKLVKKVLKKKVKK